MEYDNLAAALGRVENHRATGEKLRKDLFQKIQGFRHNPFTVIEKENQLAVFGVKIRVNVEIQSQAEQLKTEGTIAAYRLTTNANGEQQEPRPIGKSLRFDVMGTLDVPNYEFPSYFVTHLLEDLVKEKFVF